MFAITVAIMNIMFMHESYMCAYIVLYIMLFPMFLQNNKKKSIPAADIISSVTKNKFSF